jgi:hypothetical protein
MGDAFESEAKWGKWAPPVVITTWTIVTPAKTVTGRRGTWRGTGQTWRVMMIMVVIVVVVVVVVVSGS